MHNITACCILHNYCIAHDDEADDDWLINCEYGNDNEDDDEDDNDGHDSQGNSDADNTRETLFTVHAVKLVDSNKLRKTQQLS